MAKTGRIGKGGHGRPRTSGGGGGGGGTTFVAHPRLFLTSAKLTELTNKKNANHADYVAMKNYVDTYLMPVFTELLDNSTLTAPLDATSTSFTVVDGSAFPASDFYVRIHYELIHVGTRTGNTLSGCTRGDTTATGHATVAMAHVSGATVWEHQHFGGYVELPPMAALLYQLGVAGYATKVRALMSLLTMYAGAADRPLNLDWIRWYWPGIALTFDWGYNAFTADEIDAYSDLMGATVEHHLHDYALSKIWYARDVIGRTSVIESGLFANIANGQLRSEVMLTAAIAGDYAGADAHWTEIMSEINTWLTPALTTGNAAGGVSLEGSEYNAESWHQSVDIYYALASALGDNSWLTVVDAFGPNFAKYLFYASLPGSTNDATTTTGTITNGSNSLVVASATGWSVGMPLRMNLPVSPYGHESYITNISGTTFTLRDAAKASGTNQTVTHASRQLTWCDALEDPSALYADTYIWAGHVEAMHHILDRLRTSNPTYASYVRHWLDNIAPPVRDEGFRTKFMWNDSTVSATNYNTLPTLFASAEPGYFGFAIGRSAWANPATIVTMIVGGECWDHTHSDWNSYMIRRNNVRLSENIQGYGVTPFPGPWANPNPNYQQVEEGKHRGARYQNTILMNNHGGVNGNSSVQNDSATGITAQATRYHVASDFLYVRGDASNAYKGDWVSAAYSGSPAPYNSNAADVFIRDFLYVKPDLLVIVDRVGYTASALSQTQWNVQFANNPTIVGNTITLSFAGQAIRHDFLVPTTPTLTKVDNVVEYPDIALRATPTNWRVEVKSGATASTEYSLQFIQTGDAGFSPSAPALLTTTNANIGQCGTLVAGGVKGTSVTLPISYNVTGTPREILFGFNPNTAYHVTRSVNTVTIATATGSGDTTANAAGILEFTL